MVVRASPRNIIRTARVAMTLCERLRTTTKDNIVLHDLIDDITDIDQPCRIDIAMYREWSHHLGPFTLPETVPYHLQKRYLP